MVLPKTMDKRLVFGSTLRSSVRISLGPEKQYYIDIMTFIAGCAGCPLFFPALTLSDDGEETKRVRV